MTRDLARAFEKLDKSKSRVLAALDTWDEAQLSFRPSAGTWSAVDVVEHLAKVEHGFNATLRAVRPGSRVVGWRERAKAFGVFSVMRSPLRVQVPTAARQVVPSGETTLAQARRSWDEARESLRHFVDGIGPDEAQFGLFRHPVSGWMTPKMGLTFLKVHLEHHRHQLRRLRAARAK